MEYLGACGLRNAPLYYRPDHRPPTRNMESQECVGVKGHLAQLSVSVVLIVDEAGVLATD